MERHTVGFIFLGVFTHFIFLEVGGCLTNSTQIKWAVINSDLIFTGKIIELNPESKFTFQESYYFYNFTRKRRSQLAPNTKEQKEGGGWRAKVKVKTLFKGKRERKSLEGETLEVLIGEKGQGPCPVRRLRLLDTRVFFYAQRNSGELEETLLPLPPSLLVLSTVRQAVKDEPCADKECPLGGSCRVENGIGVCRCKESCSSVYSPVCGSDEVSYFNECHLAQFACQHETRIGIKHTGECNEENPCREKICGHGSKCTISSNGSALCICTECNKNREEQYSTVCGSDGKVYGSKCELEHSGCENGKNILIKYIGKCDPCEDIVCPHPSVCQLDGDRNPICECGDICDLNFRPVCGSDGMTYNSECEMKQASCRTKQDLRIIYKGKCSSGVNPCESVECRGFESCVINGFGIPQCTCPSICPPVVQLVCGSDGLTYDSECTLTTSACREEKDLKVAYRGSCELCEGVQCSFGGRCEGGWCICPTHCPSAHEPVCGSNSVTYDNECELQKSSCLLPHPISLSFYGECSTLTKWSRGHEISNCSSDCNKMGTMTTSCDSSGECFCRPGVGGLFCDQCLPGYWGLHLISIQGKEGCQRCECSSIGSIRDDCEQMSGHCECKEGVMGVKCDSCEGGGMLSSLGCTFPSTDGTESPHSYRWTGIDYTEPGDEAGNLDMRSSRRVHGFKSTRHLQQLPAIRPTPVTFQMKSYLGDSCLTSVECLTPHSLCLNGWCACAEGFHQDAELIQCKQIHSRESCPRGFCGDESTCFDYQNGSYACACPLGRSTDEGEKCSKMVAPMPFFDGFSWIGLGQLGGSHKLSLQLQITPTFNFANGILLFSSQNDDGRGDFLSLALIDGHVEFRYDLGDGVGVLRSGGQLDGGKTYEIGAKRYNQDGLLQVNGEEIKGSSPGKIKSLNLNNKGFLGGLPSNLSRVWESVGTSAGFVGCIQKLVVGRRVIEFEEGMETLLNSYHGVHQCFPKGHSTLSIPSPLEFPSVLAMRGPKNPCHSSPCLNNGECWTESVHGFRCICHPQFTGKRCELVGGGVRESELSVDFRGFSYLELPPVESGSREIQIEIWLFPRSPDGVVLYTGQESGRGDYLTLILSGGFLSFLFNLGSGTANITWSVPLSLSEWHWVVASRVGRQGKLQVDGGIPELGKSPPTLSELNLGLPLYIAGIPDEDLFVREVGIPVSFDGVVQRLIFNGDNFQGEIQNGIEEGSLEKYSGAPCGLLSSPCHNGGTCFPRLNHFHCLCPTHFTGLNCQIRKGNPGPVHFNGKTFLQFPRKIIKRMKVQRRNEIEIVFKTNSTASSVLIWIGKSGEFKKGRRGYLGLFLVDGGLELRVDLGPRKHKKPITLRSKVKVNDGRWHQVLIVRRRRLIVFQVDEQIPQRATSPVGSNVLVSDGKIWIGGVGDRIFPPEIPPSYQVGFRGCVDLIKMEKRRLPLYKVAETKGVPSCTEMDEY